MGLLLALWGIVKGVFNTFAGVMTMGDEAIANMFGQGTKGGFKAGARQLARGMTQIFLIDNSSYPRPTSKAKQEAPKPQIRKAKQEAPKPQIRKAKQEAPKPQISKAKQETPKPQISKAKQVQTSRQPEPKDTYLQRSLANGEPKPNTKWLALVNNYENARRRNQADAMRNIQFLMSQADPSYYVWLLKEVKKKKCMKAKG